MSLTNNSVFRLPNFNDLYRSVRRLDEWIVHRRHTRILHDSGTNVPYSTTRVGCAYAEVVDRARHRTLWVSPKYVCNANWVLANLQTGLLFCIIVIKLYYRYTILLLFRCGEATPGINLPYNEPSVPCLSNLPKLGSADDKL